MEELLQLAEEVAKLDRVTGKSDELKAKAKEILNRIKVPSHGETESGRSYAIALLAEFPDKKELIFNVFVRSYPRNVDIFYPMLGYARMETADEQALVEKSKTL